MDLEARLWRGVSRHLDLNRSIQGIAKIIDGYVPIGHLTILSLQLSQDPPTLLIAATSSPQQSSAPPGREHHSALCAADLKRLQSWGTQQRFALIPEARSDLRAILAPEEAPGQLLAGPLVSEGSLVAAALLSPREGEPLDTARVAALQVALQPLLVAFENDQRIQEIARMRAALEADREALLSRLQRQDISEVIIGATGGLQQVLERVEQVAPTDAPVLILGETGSGKEVIARALHDRSRRSRGPVVRVNCGAIPPQLVDSELFGHERGAFTGAVASRQGWFERADGGTLFLDEIAELPLAAQVRLLRVLQDGTLQRVGGSQPLRVDVRVVAATNQRLEEMIAGGRFREDLWYRLGVFPIRLPALRERHEDIPALAEHFAERAGRRLGGSGLSPSPEDLELLTRYSWPGNIRELAAVIERAAILGNGKRLDIPTALGVCTEEGPAVRDAAPPRNPNDATQAGPFASLDQVMVDHIVRALEASRGRIEGTGGAAHLLKINPHTLRARMKKHGVQPDRFRSRTRPEPE